MLFSICVCYQQVDEYGTEAAAATAVVVVDVAALEPETPDLIVTLDQPFIHLICHKQSGAILFMGRMSKPSGEFTWNNCDENEGNCPNIRQNTDGAPVFGGSLCLYMILSVVVLYILS